MILVFEDSRIVAQGSHTSLYESSALYKALYDRQQSTNVIARVTGAESYGSEV
jgi:ABC-type transport system involved in cytochrome bd biosynthesis fused ATPase/permease subunit